MVKRYTNTELAELLRDVAASYQLKDEKKNRFRIIAYNRAADAIEHASSDVQDLWEEDKLSELAGVGESITSSFRELFLKGKSKHFDDVVSGIPPQVFVLMRIPGIGPKTAFTLVKTLNVSQKDPIDSLKSLAEAQKIRTLDGFGEKSEADILKSLQEYSKKVPARKLISEADATSASVIEWMKKNQVVERVEALGSLRRKASTIGDIDIGVSTSEPIEALSHFSLYPGSSRVLEKGERSSSILLPNNIQVDCKVQEPKRFGSLLQHFTGSKHHNVALRELALKKGLSLSEYGIKKVKDGKTLTFSTEEAFYKYLGMEWIPPELREDTGEINEALSNDLPKLVELSDVKGDLHMHSDFDIETSHDIGESTSEDLISEATSLGYEYIAFSEHNPSQSGHDASQIISILKRKKENVEQLNYSIVKSMKKGIKKVFNSLEIDIKPDGSLPVPEKGLEFLDFALVSIHSSFDMDKKKMTERVIKAFKYPKVKIFAHPTARLLNKRSSIDLDWEKIFRECLDRNIFLEINADPHRLDLPDVLVKDAIKAKVRLSLGTDSHSRFGLTNMKYGVYVARRGWASKESIVNTYSLDLFQKLIL